MTRESCLWNSCSWVCYRRAEAHPGTGLGPSSAGLGEPWFDPGHAQGEGTDGIDSAQADVATLGKGRGLLCVGLIIPAALRASKSTREREQQLPARRGDTNPVHRLRVKYVSIKSSMFSWAEDDTSINKPSAQLEFSFYLQIFHLNCISSLSQTRTSSSPIQETGAWGITSNHMPRLWSCHCCGTWVSFGTSRGR